MDRQIDEAVGVERCESHNRLDVDEPIYIIRLIELHMNVSEQDDKTCWSRSIV